MRISKTVLKRIGIAALLVILLAGVILIAVSLDNTSGTELDPDRGSTPGTSQTSTQSRPDPSGTEGDMIEGSMGVVENPFDE